MDDTGSTLGAALAGSTIGKDRIILFVGEGSLCARFHILPPSTLNLHILKSSIRTGAVSHDQERVKTHDFRN